MTKINELNQFKNLFVSQKTIMNVYMMAIQNMMILKNNKKNNKIYSINQIL